ncbi:HK97 family phage prohead protease [Alloprevotella tannerae]|uniref:HK97 family phage prohead protease n=1 Tax=Alloprevotella tannerae TaxID=76122 RepID=UPI0028E28659|nr:HK97 family phage prohead protease [Alloprevotella tannerae]
MNKEKVIRRCLCAPSELRVREAREGEQPSRTITGYAILFNTPSVLLWSDDDSEAREEIAPEAITKAVLDAQDVKMTMFHDRQLILARSNKGAGTLSYSVDEKGVAFEFEAPHTADGDKALELVRRGDICGCSFAFSTRYYDQDFVERKSEVLPNGCNKITYRVKAVIGIYDFTLAADPYYQETSVEARELVADLKRGEGPTHEEEEKKREEEKRAQEQVREMRALAEKKIV